MIPAGASSSESTARSAASTSCDPVPELIRQLADANIEKRLAAIQDLSRLGSLALDALPALSGLVGDADAHIRKAAARALGKMGTIAMDPLTKALEHGDKEVRRQAVWGLARLGTQAAAAIPALSKALQDPDSRTASGAAQALANMGPDAAAAVPALVAALQNINLVQCRLVAKALSQIGPVALPALLDKLGNQDHDVQREVAAAIGFMGPQAGSAVGPIVEHLRSLSAVPCFPVPAPEMLDEADGTRVTPIKPVTSENIDVRVLFIETLARIGPAACTAREYLLAAMNDSDRRVGQAAAQALLRIMGWN